MFASRFYKRSRKSGAVAAPASAKNIASHSIAEKLMPFKTRITAMLGIEHPIVQGGMQVIGVAKLAAAVSNAGGLGIITGLTQPTPAALRDEIERCRSLTAKPFAVNMTVLPTTRAPDYAGYAR